MLEDREVNVDHTTIYRWIQAYAAELEKRIRPHPRLSNDRIRKNQFDLSKLSNHTGSATKMWEAVLAA